jgi:hypothetical protein
MFHSPALRNGSCTSANAGAVSKGNKKRGKSRIGRRIMSSVDGSAHNPPNRERLGERIKRIFDIQSATGYKTGAFADRTLVARFATAACRLLVFAGF